MKNGKIAGFFSRYDSLNQIVQGAILSGAERALGSYNPITPATMTYGVEIYI